MSTPLQRAVSNLSTVQQAVGTMPITSGALQGLCALLAAEIVADAIKEAFTPAPAPVEEPLNIGFTRTGENK